MHLKSPFLPSCVFTISHLEGTGNGSCRVRIHRIFKASSSAAKIDDIQHNMKSWRSMWRHCDALATQTFSGLLRQTPHLRHRQVRRFAEKQRLATALRNVWTTTQSGDVIMTSHNSRCLREVQTDSRMSEPVSEIGAKKSSQTNWASLFFMHSIKLLLTWSRFFAKNPTTL